MEKYIRPMNIVGLEFFKNPNNVKYNASLGKLFVFLVLCTLAVHCEN